VSYQKGFAAPLVMAVFKAHIAVQTGRLIEGTVAQKFEYPMAYAMTLGGQGGLSGDFAQMKTIDCTRIF